MLFNTYQFTVVFAPTALLTFYLLRRFAPPSVALASIIVASLLFYAHWRAAYVPVLVASILINYALGSAILGKVGARAFLAAGVVLNLGFLGYFKYVNFLVAQVNDAFRLTFADPGVVLPLAVSFYTFQQIAYLTDCYRGKIHDNNFLRYTFVVTFFPHLVAGPIVRMQEISHQFARSFTKHALQNIAIGLTLFVVGLGKKLLVADYFGSLANPLFGHVASGGTLSFVNAWTAALSYTLQLYFDFSGYSDMAIGLARMFGFRLAVNFLSPYKSVNISDFWRRWHITLSRFLRDYLYIPLGGSRRGLLRNYINLIVTMALGGLWHGAAWTFVAWGFYHGLLLAGHRAWRASGFSKSLAGGGFEIVSWAVTFASVVVGWVLFRSTTFSAAATMLQGMFSRPNLAEVRSHDVVIIIGLTFCWVAPNVYQILYRYRPALLLREQVHLLRNRRFHYVFQFRTIEAAALSAVFVSCFYAMHGTPSTFLYFMF